MCPLTIESLKPVNFPRTSKQPNVRSGYCQAFFLTTTFVENVNTIAVPRPLSFLENIDDRLSASLPRWICRPIVGHNSARNGTVTCQMTQCPFNFLSYTPNVLESTFFILRIPSPIYF
ncbi:hypothetical protein ACOME3_002936 [Neoechinorhynchus agilis]